MATSVAIDADAVTLDADLVIPDDARGVVVFAHGSGSSRYSLRNRMVAGRLQGERFATVLADLLTEREDQFDAETAALRFDIALLAARVCAVVDWASGEAPVSGLPVGLFGASTGAAAALVAAAERPSVVRAVVSRGGRPDLADDALSRVRAPTLLIVGGRDELVITLNKQAAERLTAPHELRVVPGAGHLFEEPGTLSVVADHAAGWFAERL